MSRSQEIRSDAKPVVHRQDGSWPYLRQLFLTTTPLLLADLAVLLVAVLLTSLFGFEWLNQQDVTSRALFWFPPVACAWLLINLLLGLYPGVGLGLVDEIKRLTTSAAVVGLITLARQNLTGERFDERLHYLFVAFGLTIALAPIVRSGIRKLLGATEWWGFPALVCGDDAAAINVDQWLSDNRRLGLRPLGVVADPDQLGVESAPRLLGGWIDARRLAELHHAYHAIVVDPDEAAGISGGASTFVERYLGNIPQVLIVSRLTGIPDHWNRHQMDEGLSGILVQQHLLLPIPRLVKRGLDIVVAMLAGILLAPLFAGLAIATKITSPGPVFYGHTRVGLGNTRFKAWKFRTMRADADQVLHAFLAEHPERQAEWDRDHKLKNDPRVTAIGKWLRKWSIDELPQIWNVLCGEMSVVGPRPIVDSEIAKYGVHFELFASVLPGITGLWQVCGRNDTTYEERVQLDMYYIHHWSPWLDIYLLARTIKTVLLTKGAY